MTLPRRVSILGPVEGTNRDDKALVGRVLRDLDEAAQRWEAILAEAGQVRFAADLGDIRAVADSDGRLVELTLQPSVTTDYSHVELAQRLNAAFEALREDVIADYRARYGGILDLKGPPPCP